MSTAFVTSPSGAVFGCGQASGVVRPCWTAAGGVPSSPPAESVLSTLQAATLEACNVCSKTVLLASAMAGVAAVQQRAVRRLRRRRSSQSLGLCQQSGRGQVSLAAKKDAPDPPRPKDKAAPWRRENAETRSDGAYGKRWEFSDNSKKGKHRPWGKGKMVDESLDADREASRLRSLYKRPRFGWKEVQDDDIRMSYLSDKTPAIGNGEVWLSKFLAHCGVCSRRNVTDMVLQGRVEVNGEIVQSPAVKVDPKKDQVTFDGLPQNLHTLGEIIWVMLYKKKGVLSTMEDPLGRKTVADIVPFAKKNRLLPVGRLDRNATGLLLLTNDNEWNSILTHPRHEMARTYHVTVYNGAPDREKMLALQTGLRLPDDRRPLLPWEDVHVYQELEDIVRIRFTTREGRPRMIRRAFEYIGHPVKTVKRVGVGLVWLDKELKPGEFRTLGPKEIRRLKGPTILKRPTSMRPDEERQSVAEQLKKLDQGGDDAFFEQQKRETLERKQRLEEGLDVPAWRDPELGSGKARRRRYDEDDSDFEMPTRNAPRATPRPGERASPWIDDEGTLGDLTKGIQYVVNSEKVDAWSSTVDAPAAAEKERREGSAADLDRLQSAFMGDIDVGEGMGDEGEDWEQDWIDQLDQMQAEKSTEPSR
eukprot:TRINITY_DN11397_c0_g2_i1.p1 TRINITY_DN11397_c0_g2~~TRINITY_DN11397_c0_g2_i1.p1  ORF type:complete len:670 (-),score=163.58 TRINITY_DN11397_c0_g2_i1:408-2339(-)